jgi:protein MpaA
VTTATRVIVVCAVSLLAAANIGGVDATATRPDPVVRRIVMLGRSVEGRAITAVETGDPDSPSKAVVVGCIHGNECAGIAIAERLARAPSPGGADIWVVADLNPDGAAAHTRGNAHRVDLNRNFPWRWKRLGGTYDSGPRALSEPETRIAFRLIERMRPAVSIWFHQHLNLVDDSSGSRVIERRFATAAGLRLAPLTREPGSAVTWQSHRFPRSTAFVVELPGGKLTPAATDRLACAVLLVAATAPRRSPPSERCARKG